MLRQHEVLSQTPCFAEHGPSALLSRYTVDPRDFGALNATSTKLSQELGKILGEVDSQQVAERGDFVITRGSEPERGTARSV